MVAGCVAARGHADHSDDTHARDIEKQEGRSHPQRPQDLVPAHPRAPGDGQRVVHVPNQHGPDEESAGVFGCRR